MSDLLNSYRMHVILYELEDIQGNSKSVNQEYKKIMQAYDDLKSVSKLSELLKLLQDENESVQLWSATHSLEIDALKASTMLTQLLKSENPRIALSAKYTLLEWKAGRLTFPPESTFAQ